MGGDITSASAISYEDILKIDGSPALVRGTRVVLSVWKKPPPEIRLVSFNVFHDGCYTVVVSVPGPPQRGGWRQRFLQLFHLPN